MTNLRLSATFCLMIAACAAKPAAPAEPIEPAIANTVEPAERKSTASDPYEVHALAGPFASVNAFCQPVELQTCDSFGPIPRVADKPVPAPFDDVMYLAVGGTSKLMCHLAVVVDGEWYVHEHPQKCNYLDDVSAVSASAESIYGDTLFAGSTQLVFTFSTDEMSSDIETRQRFIKARRTAMILCGVGQSGTPSCTDEITMSKWWSDEPIRGEGPTVEGTYDVDVSYDGSVMTVRTDAEELAHRAGDHTIVFP